MPPVRYGAAIGCCGERGRRAAVQARRRRRPCGRGRSPAYFSFDPPEYVAVHPDPHFPLAPSLTVFPFPYSIRDMSLLASPAAQFATEEEGNPSSIKSFVAIHPTS